MGADIHLFVEYRKSKDSDWIADTSNGFIHYHEYPDNQEEAEIYELNHFYIGRNYELFGAMAGVRCHRTRLFWPKGLPKGLSTDIAHTYQLGKEDYHTPSWLTPKQFQTCLLKVKWGRMPPSDSPWYLDPWVLLDRIEEHLSRLQADNILLGDNYKPKARLVFWFDS